MILAFHMAIIYYTQVLGCTGRHVTSRCQGLFPPDPFFEGKALGTRLILIWSRLRDRWGDLRHVTSCHLSGVPHFHVNRPFKDYCTADNKVYNTTKIVRALWLAKRSVCMRVCKHGCGVKVFCFSRAKSRKQKFEKVFKFKTRQVYFIYPFLRRLKLGKSLQRRCVNFFSLKLTF